MKNMQFGMPERDELRDLPLSPRLIGEISRLLRARMVRDVRGVMSQSTARLVMSLLAKHGTLGQQELVRLTHLTPPSISVLLRRMEQEGFIMRVADDRDRRAIRVTLTETGKAFDSAQLSRISTNDQLAMTGFTAQEQAALEGYLLRIRQNLMEVCDGKSV